MGSLDIYFIKYNLGKMINRLDMGIDWTIRHNRLHMGKRFHEIT